MIGHRHVQLAVLGGVTVIGHPADGWLLLA
jgi:hypothetical protein